jgi:hypothetical protein
VSGPLAAIGWAGHARAGHRACLQDTATGPGTSNSFAGPS